MIQTEFNSQTVFVLNDPPDWIAPVESKWTLIRDTQAGLTRREARRPYSATLRAQLRYRTTVSDEALRILQASLRALNTQPVIVPLWPVAIEWADRATASISGGLNIVWKEDWSQFAIYTDVEPVWPADDDLVAPALWGFLAPAEPQMLTADAAVWSVEFTESSPPQYAVTPAAAAFASGPLPTGYSAAPKLLPFTPDFRRVSEEVNVSVQRQQLSFTREQNQTFYPHDAARAQIASYTLGATQLPQLLRFFLDVAAPGSPFWASSWFQAAKLTGDALATDTVLEVADSAAVGIGDYVSLHSDENAVARMVVAKTANTVTLNAAVGIPLLVRDTLLLPLCLARLDKPVLSLSWQSPQFVRCELDWAEIPAVTPFDETLGVTIGRLLTRVILFEFSRDLLNGTVVTNRFTNYESDLTWSGNTYASRDISHGDIKQSLNLENDGVQLSSFIFTGNPVGLDVALKSEAPLSLVIRHADFDGVTLSNVRVVFTGQLESFSRVGSKLTAKFKAGPTSLDDQLPRMIRGTTCNHVAGANPDGSFLISYGCALLKADWKFTATVAAPISSAYPFVLNLSGLARVSGAAPDYFSDWFAFGWIEIGAGAAIQRRAILKSTVPVSGVLSVTLHRWFETAPVVGDAVVIYPGCDGTPQTCKGFNALTNAQGKFDNYLNFGGEPFTPAGNPSLSKVASSPPRGAKK